jgi:hypothetical protein
MKLFRMPELRKLSCGELRLPATSVAQKTVMNYSGPTYCGAASRCNVGMAGNFSGSNLFQKRLDIAD